ncbi:pyridoxal phosphate-dependent transferase [Cladochytrium replicatum]|nr:pyridoxal phosphate-dependent transferase [Cladochytrium replicatum]
MTSMAGVSSQDGTHQYQMEDLTLYPTDDPDYIQFEFGAPGPDLAPTDLIATAATDCFSSGDGANYLQYGPILGSKELRDELASFLSVEYRSAVSGENLVLTNGASGSFSNIITWFTSPDTEILIENPTYFLAIRTLEDHGFVRSKMHTLHTDPDTGIDPAFLRAKLESLPQRPLGHSGVSSGAWTRYPYLLYLVPTFSNPTGATIPEAHRAEIVELARKHNVLIVCDDIYEIMYYGESSRPPKRIAAFDQDPSPIGSWGGGNVISNCTFSKIFAPGLRLGWIEASPAIVDQCRRSGLLYSGGTPNHTASGIALALIRNGGLQSHLNRLRKTYRNRRDVLYKALEQQAPKSIVSKIHAPLGGFFIWIELNRSAVLDTKKLLDSVLPTDKSSAVMSRVEGKHEKDADTIASYEGIVVPRVKASFAPGNIFSPDRTFGHCLRLSFAHYEEEQLELGCSRLCSVLNALAGVKV